MSKTQKGVKKVKGFNMNKKTGHVSLAYSQQGQKVKSIGFTHNPSEKHGKLEKLNHNINPEDSSDCYVHVDVEKQKAKDYVSKPKYDKYRIHVDDELTIEIIKQKDNKKR